MNSRIKPSDQFAKFFRQDVPVVSRIRVAQTNELRQAFRCRQFAQGGAERASSAFGPRDLLAPATSSLVDACSMPASGPESKLTWMTSGPDACASGTRTEAGQNVPQEKPERARASVCCPAPQSVISAPWPS